FAERSTGVDPELVDKRAAAGLEDRERLRLATGAVEREHQLGAPPLPGRVVVDDRPGLPYALGVAPELEVDVDSLLEDARPQLLEPGDLGLREALVGKVGKGSPAPQRDGLAADRPRR